MQSSFRSGYPSQQASSSLNYVRSNPTSTSLRVPPTLSHISYIPIQILQLFQKSTNASEALLSRNNLSDIQNSVSIKLISVKNPLLKVASVIITINEGESYDPIFRQVQQTNSPGYQTLVYQISENVLKFLQQSFDKSGSYPLINDMVKEIKKLPAECVVFNWECCSTYFCKKFKDKQGIFKFVKFALSRGFMLMFSDFSLKCLITHWDQAVLGPNPFIMNKSLEQSEVVELNYNTEQLKKCCSKQLQILGSLSEQDYCKVQALESTITYKLRKINFNHNKYQLEVLTKAYVPSLLLLNQYLGHVLLHYPSGGKILTSMTHWKELRNVNTSEERLLDFSAMMYGEEYSKTIKESMDKQSVSEKADTIQRLSKSYIVENTPSISSYKNKA